MTRLARGDKHRGGIHADGSDIRCDDVTGENARSTTVTTFGVTQTIADAHVKRCKTCSDKPPARRGKDVPAAYTGPDWIGETHVSRILRQARAE